MWWTNGNNKVPKHLPLAKGPFAPGAIDVMVDYSIKGLFMRIYYPTNKTNEQVTEEHKKWIPWLPNCSYADYISKVVMTYKTIIKLVMWWAGNVHIPLLFGEKPRTIDKLNCIILSHGLGSTRFLYSSICYDLASYGFLVVALEHRDNSCMRTYYYQSEENAKNDIKTAIEYRRIDLGKGHFDARHKQVVQRSEECLKVLNFLKKLNDGDVPHNIMEDTPNYPNYEFKLSDLVGKLNIENTTVMGHSFGAATALLTMSKRPEIRQGIILDPWMFPIKNENVHEQVNQKLIFINTQTFHIATNVDAMSKFLTDGRQMYTILRTTHENQCDSVLVYGNWLNWGMKKINPEVGVRLNNALILRFLHEQLGQPANINDLNKYIQENKDYLQEGLTKPWA